MIILEYYYYLLNTALTIIGLAILVFIANSLRQKSGLGWLDFLHPLGRYIVVIVPAMFKGPFTIRTMVCICIAGFIMWLVLSPVEEEFKKPSPPKKSESITKATN